jgi:hypothetical protein
LADALKYYSLVRATPVQAKTYVEDGRKLVTWYKLHVAEMLSSAPVLPNAFGLEDVHPDIYPHDLLPVAEDELLVVRNAGSALVDGVQITREDDFPEFSILREYLIALALDKSGTVGAMHLGPHGAFRIGEADSLVPLVESLNNPLAIEIRQRFGGSLRAIRNVTRKR